MNPVVISEPNNETSENNSEQSSCTATPSASKKKLVTLNSEACITNASDTNLILDFSIFKSVFHETVCCNLCGGEINISDDISKTNGLICSLKISCLNCESKKEFCTSEKYKDNDLFETNFRFFYGLRCIGKRLYVLY